jgi:hypothetical protein
MSTTSEPTLGLLEIRWFTVRPGTRDEFHRVSRDGSIPLMRRRGITVLTHGPNRDDDDGYVLVRWFASETDRRAHADGLYSSAEWLENYEEPVMSMIDQYRTAVLPAAPGVLDSVLRPDGPDDVRCVSSEVTG